MKTLIWLVRRELWEHRGSLVWAPLVASLLFVMITALGVAFGTLHGGPLNLASLAIQGQGTMARADIGKVLDAWMVSGTVILAVILGLCLFTYCLGALYNDRRDGSVLFWKSLPISDTQTVISKAITALIVAPLLVLGVGALTGWLLLGLAALVLTSHGLPLAWIGYAHPFQVFGGLLLLWPLYALTALPTVGWLLACSAWSRSKPFLWAVALPIAAACLLSGAGDVPLSRMAVGMGWLLMGFFPGYGFHGVGHLRASLPTLPDLVGNYWVQAAQSPELWLGAILGGGLLLVTIQGRRRAVRA